jgi:hypothetical protein
MLGPTYLLHPSPAPHFGGHVWPFVSWAPECSLCLAAHGISCSVDSGAPLWGVKWPEHEADLSLKSKTELKIVCTSTSTPPIEFQFLFILCKPTLFLFYTPSTSAVGPFFSILPLVIGFHIASIQFSDKRKLLFCFPRYLILLS